MSSNGMCRHNNFSGYCVACSGEKRMQNQSMNGGGMGAACQEGYYEAEIFGIKTGQCIPNLRTVTEGATAGVSQTVATGVADSPATQAAVQTAASNALGQKIFSFYKDQPVIAWGATAAIALLVVYGGMNFIRGK